MSRRSRRRKTDAELLTKARLDWRCIVLGLALIAVTLAVFSPALGAGYIWDDDAYVYANNLLPAPDGLWRIWLEPLSTPQYYPLVHTTYWLEYRIWGLSPGGYHAVNILLHAGAAVLLWLALRRLEVPWAWLAALVFAIHPLQVESVAWITERKNVLSGLLAMASLLTYLLFLKHRDQPATRDLSEEKPQETQPATLDLSEEQAEKSQPAASQRKWLWYGAAIVFFLLALLSKTVTAMLPVVLVLLAWWKDGTIGRRDVLPLIPMFALGAVFGLLTVVIERQHVGATGMDWNLTFLERCLVASRAICFYPMKLVVPISLAFQYPKWDVDAGVWWQYLFPIGVLAVLAVLVVKRKQWGLGPLVALLAFATLLFPALGFFNVYPHRYSFVADHFQYLACVPLIVLCVAGLAKLAARGANESLAAKSAAASVVFVLGILAWGQCALYEDEEVLYRKTLERNPKAFLAYNNLGYMLLERGDTWEAREMFERCLAIEGAVVDRHHHLSNLGLAHATDGNWATAAKYYRESVEAREDNGEAHANLGLALLRLEQPEDAISSLIRAVELEPQRIAYRLSLADAFATQQRTDEAVAILRETVALAPYDADARFRLSRALGWNGELEAAVLEATQAIMMNPNISHWHSELGILFAKSGEWTKAIEATQYAQALAASQGQAGLAEQLATRIQELQERARAADDSPSSPPE